MTRSNNLLMIMAWNVRTKRTYGILLIFGGILCLTMLYQQRLLIQCNVTRSSPRGVHWVNVEAKFLRTNSKHNTTTTMRTPINNALLLHRLASRDEIFRKVSDEWRNLTELNEARIREIRKEIEENSDKFAAGDLRLFLRTVRNEKAVQEIRKEVMRTMFQCHAMQIVRPHVPVENIVFESKLRDIMKTNQSDCVPVYDSCAIVGNSGILLGSECGEVIDSADFVIRNNMATIEERFARDVGMRVDAMSINLELIRALTLCTNVHKGGNLKMPPRTACGPLMEKMKIFQKGQIFWFFKRYTKLFDEMKAMLTALRKKYHLNFRLGYSPIIPMDTARRLAQVRVPSSGLAVYVAATQFCKSINLFGFYPFNDLGTSKNTVMNHYYDEKVYYLSRDHEIPKEYAWLVELDKSGAIRMINDCTSLRR